MARDTAGSSSTVRMAGFAMPPSNHSPAAAAPPVASAGGDAAIVDDASHLAHRPLDRIRRHDRDGGGDPDASLDRPGELGRERRTGRIVHCGSSLHDYLEFV